MNSGLYRAGIIQHRFADAIRVCSRLGRVGKKQYWLALLKRVGILKRLMVELGKYPESRPTAFAHGSAPG